MASTASSGDRAAHFPAIERRHGRPVQHWIDAVAALGEVPYGEQMAFLRDVHGFSRTHANAVVMTVRGSTSARRFDGPEAYFASIGADHARLARAILAAITDSHPDLELVIAWNQPMLRRGTEYVFGLSASATHLTIAPWHGLSDAVRAQLGGLHASKKTVRVPLDWEIDTELLELMVTERLAMLDG